METQIGQSLKSSTSAWSAVIIATATVVTDLWLSSRSAYSETPRILVAVVAVVLVAVLCHGNRASLGVSHRMLPTNRYWVGATLILGAIIGLFCLVASLLLHLTEIHLPMSMTAPSQILPEGIRMCVVAPLLEESIYRLVLCVPLVAVAGPGITILVAGSVFAGLHFAYGNPSPDNVIAGFFLSWAFLKSGSFLIPVLLHSLGNACALAAHVIHWHLVN